MPLSERLRIQAGRPFIHTLAARILVAMVLLIITVIITSKTVDNFDDHSGHQISNDPHGITYAKSESYDIHRK